MTARKAQPLECLVVTECFTVIDVLATTTPTSFTPTSEMMIGGSSPRYSGGHTSQVVLQVTPEDSRVPVCQLTFEGFSAVRIGEYVAAKIPRYEEFRVGERTGMDCCGPWRSDDLSYRDRDFQEHEKVIELALLSEEGKVLRRERSADYSQFLRV